MKSLLILAAVLPLVFGRIGVPAFGPEVPMLHREAAPAQFLTAASSQDPLQIAVGYLDANVPVSDGFGYVIKNHYKSKDSQVMHVYVRQTVNGVEVVNGDANLNIDQFGRVISFHSSFFQGVAPADNGFHVAAGQQLTMQPAIPDDDIVTPSEAVVEFAKFLKLPSIPDVHSFSEMFLTDDESAFPGASTDEPVFVVSNVPFTSDSKIPMTRRYLIVDDAEQLRLAPVWDIVVDHIQGDDWFNAQLDSASGKVYQLVNWVSEAQYRVYPIGVNDPADGERQVVVNPADAEASPKGWHDQADAGRGRGPSRDGKYTSTVGNNVFAQSNPDGRNSYENNYRPEGGKQLAFDFPVDLAMDPSSYINASITNLFYWNNIMHDVFYAYGFDEVSGNFQEDNFGRGGRGGDAVIANAQDGSGYNNANFATPPDGNKGRMRMYVWTTSKPRRDGDLEAGIIIHEYAHGISTRLTGGPLNSNCLGWGEAGGMGEGWGDTFATALRMRDNYTRENNFPMGEYSAGRGIRPYPYSTSMKTNPQLYSTIRSGGYGGVHAQGSVWATILYEVYWNLVDKAGFEKNWYSVRDLASGKSVKGNIRFLKVVVEGMKLQPCRPTFIDARNAILKADETVFGGENVCEIWKGFAKRGLGVDAKPRGVDGFNVPTECQ